MGRIHTSSRYVIDISTPNLIFLVELKGFLVLWRVRCFLICKDDEIDNSSTESNFRF